MKATARLPKICFSLFTIFKSNVIKNHENHQKFFEFIYDFISQRLSKITKIFDFYRSYTIKNHGNHQKNNRFG